MTDREQEVLSLLERSDGLTAREVSDMLGIAMSTASCHLRALRLDKQAHFEQTKYKGSIKRTTWFAGPGPETKLRKPFPSVWAYAAAGGD